MKTLLYQVIGLGVIWIGMALFYSDMDTVSRIIFYVVTSWLLLLIGLFIKQLVKGRDKDDDSTIGR